MTETRTYSAEEAAEIICGSSTPADVHWLKQRLRGSAQPVLPGYKAQRHWRMTEEHITEALRLLQPERPLVPEVPVPSTLMRRSRRRLSA